MTPEILQLKNQIEALTKRVSELETRLKTHSHTGLDGSAPLNGSRVVSLIFQGQGLNRTPQVDGEFFYHNSSGIQNFRLQMIDRNVNPPLPRNWTINLSAL